MELLESLRMVAPNVAIDVLWEEDEHPDCSIFAEGNALANEDPCNWTAWDSEVRATAVVGGRIVCGAGYLGDTWERSGDNPAVSNPDISGYLPQKAEEALQDLLRRLGHQDRELRWQIDLALRWLKDHMRQRYEQQRQEAAQ